MRCKKSKTDSHESLCINPYKKQGDKIQCRCCHNQTICIIFRHEDVYKRQLMTLTAVICFTRMSPPAKADDLNAGAFVLMMFYVCLLYTSSSAPPPQRSAPSTALHSSASFYNPDKAEPAPPSDASSPAGARFSPHDAPPF